MTMNLTQKMRQFLSPDVNALLRKIGKMSDEMGTGAFIVGGLVRDMLLGRSNIDLDIVVEGDASELGRKMAKELGGTLVVHKRFGTAVVILHDRMKIDLATARKEVYEKPAALPTVEFGSLRDDLARRDFTINAMAVSISEKSYGQLVDFFDGVGDLKSGTIRVMHDKSFVDDPTRIFRAVRFEQRLGFKIETHTEKLIQSAVDESMFEKVSHERVRNEIVLILKEKDPFKAIKRMDWLHELRFIHPKIKLDKALEASFHAVDGAVSWFRDTEFRVLKRPLESWLVYLMVLLSDLTPGEVDAVAKRFIFRRGETIRLLSWKRDISVIEKRFSGKTVPDPGKVHDMLYLLSYESLLALLATTKSLRIKNAVKAFLEHYNGVRVSINGTDVINAGVKPGPKVRRILEAVRREKINGRVRTKSDELIYLSRLVRRR